MHKITIPAEYVAQVESVVKAGGTITEKFRTIAARWEAFTETESNIQDELNAAILDPNVPAEELARLRTLAVAAEAATLVNKAAVRNETAAHVTAALRTEYRTIAAANYETIRQAFNTKAQQLTAALTP